MTSLLITGATGSLGTALLEHLLTTNEYDRYVIYSRDELKQADLAVRLKHDIRLRFFLGDVRDKSRLIEAMHGVDDVIHAAALKRVDALEYNPLEGVKTNVLGAANVIEAAFTCSVHRVMGISTDKAVNPLNLYGATKLCAEKLFVAANKMAGSRPTRFSCVRYGNVAGSRGSVIPLWRAMLDKCERLTVTDEHMSRFWMVLPDAVRFVLSSMERMTGGEVYVPKLRSFMVTALCRAMSDQDYQVTGIRPGEKLHEAMIGPDEPVTELDDRYLVGRGETGQAYSSDKNPDWLLCSEELVKLLEDV